VVLHRTHISQWLKWLAQQCAVKGAGTSAAVKTGNRLGFASYAGGDFTRLAALR
jgi:hypothetical protein